MLKEELAKTHLPVMSAAIELGIRRGRVYDALAAGELDGLCDARAGWMVSLASIAHYKARLVETSPSGTAA